MNKYFIAFLAALVVLAACSYYQTPNQATVPANSVQPPPEQQAQSSAPAQQSLTYVTTSQTSLGEILVDDNGMTLYVFSKDTTPGQSACYSTCAQNWPALTGNPAARVSLPGALSTITRTDGMMQIAYGNKPLYHYAGDNSPGDTKGNGFAGLWSVVVITQPAAPVQQQSSGFGY